MAAAETLSQANVHEMAALSVEAKELNATTKFTAKEAGDAMGYMAMAGWDVNDMLQGMDGVLQLAAASGEDLAMVSDIVTDSLSAFGPTAKDTATSLMCWLPRPPNPTPTYQSWVRHSRCPHPWPVRWDTASRTWSR